MSVYFIMLYKFEYELLLNGNEGYRQTCLLRIRRLDFIVFIELNSNMKLHRHSL